MVQASVIRLAARLALISQLRWISFVLGKAGNCDLQPAITNLMISYIHLSIGILDVSFSILVIADFDASHGKNSITAMKACTKYLQQINTLVTSLLVVHNDLPTNDWTKLFHLLAENKSYQDVTNVYSLYE
ncbi:unnamed protein product [Rotaria sp. Silwood1]|nr:unnamed protein product [Rotaria sp. Silwood1]